MVLKQVQKKTLKMKKEKFRVKKTTEISKQFTNPAKKTEMKTTKTTRTIKRRRTVIIVVTMFAFIEIEKVNKKEK